VFAHDVSSGIIWDVVDAQRKCPWGTPSPTICHLNLLTFLIRPEGTPQLRITNYELRIKKGTASRFVYKLPLLISFVCDSRLPPCTE